MIKLGDLAIPLFVAAMLVVGVVAVYRLGEKTGTAEVQNQWKKESGLQEAAMNRLQGEYDVLQTQHQKRVGELSRELQNSLSEYEAALHRDRATHAERLLNAETRASVYQRQARGSVTEQERLARHAAELDRTLEEGRALVREFGETLRQRDITIRALGGIIAADRTLLSENQ